MLISCENKNGKVIPLPFKSYIAFGFDNIAKPAKNSPTPNEHRIIPAVLSATLTHPPYPAGVVRQTLFAIYAKLLTWIGFSCRFTINMLTECPQL